MYTDKTPGVNTQLNSLRARLAHQADLVRLAGLAPSRAAEYAEARKQLAENIMERLVTE